MNPRKGDRRKCDPDKCEAVLKERRKSKEDRRKLDKERIIREYHEAEADAYREAIQSLVKRTHQEKKTYKP